MRWGADYHPDPVLEHPPLLSLKHPLPPYMVVLDPGRLSLAHCTGRTSTIGTPTAEEDPTTSVRGPQNDRWKCGQLTALPAVRCTVRRLGVVDRPM